MKVTITELGLGLKRELEAESIQSQQTSSTRRQSTSLPRQAQTQRSLAGVDSLLQALIMHDPPRHIQVRSPRVAISPRLWEKYAADSSSMSRTRVGNFLGAAVFSSGAFSRSPRELAKNVQRERAKLISSLGSRGRLVLRESALVSRGLKMDKVRDMQQEMLKRRSELDSRLKLRLNKIRKNRDEQLLEHRTRIEEFSTPEQQPRGCKEPDKERYRRRVMTKHQRRVSSWKQSERLLELSTPRPRQRMARSPYAKLRMSMTPEESFANVLSPRNP